MKKLSTKQLKILRNLICVAGIAGGFVLWTFLPDTFRNGRLFHVGNGEFGFKAGALILCPLCDAAESLPPSPKMEGFSLTKLILVFVGMTFVLWLLLKGISLLINLILSRA